MDPLSAKEILPALYAFLCVTASAGVGAAVLFFKYRAGKNWLPLPRLRWGRWTGADVVLIVVMLYMAQSLVHAILDRMHFFTWFYGEEPSRIRESLWVTPLALPLFLALAFAGLRGLSGTYPVDLGLSLSRWRANLLLGYVAFVLITPVVLLLFQLLSLASDVKPHQFVELIKKEGRPKAAEPKGGEAREGEGQAKAEEANADEFKGGMLPIEWMLLFFSAALAAPVIEEILFRGVIQGWLRRASLAGHVTLIVLIMLSSFGSSLQIKKSPKEPKEFEDIVDNIEKVNWSRMSATLGLGLLYIAWLCKFQQRKLFLSEADFAPEPSTQPDKETETEDQETPPTGENVAAAKPGVPTELPSQGKPDTGWEVQDLEQQRRKSGLVIFGSALTFALVHPGWPDPLPLLLLGLGLGWLAQRTQNLLPCIVVHALFNAVATFTLLFQSFE